MPPILALTGIHTDIGKTVCAAVWVQAMGCDYWKPIQAGALTHSDTDAVRGWVTRTDVTFHPERHRFALAASPHTAARAQNTVVELSQLTAPATHRPLLIETAGGVHSPVTDRHTVADLLAHHGWPTLLVVRHYLGSIGHTLGAIEGLTQRGIPIMGLLINGAAHTESEQFILDYTGLSIVARVGSMNTLHPATIAAQAELLRS